jgi:hypothetical protein
MAKTKVQMATRSSGPLSCLLVKASVKFRKPTSIFQPGLSFCPVDDARGVGERVLRRVVHEVRLVEVRAARVIRAQRSIGRVRGDRHRHRGDGLLVSKNLVEAKRLVARETRARPRAVESGVLRLRERHRARTHRHEPVGVGDEEVERAVLPQDVDGVGRRVGDALEGRPLDGAHGIRLGAVVSVAVVGERDVAAEEDHEDLEDQQEDDAGGEVLARESLVLAEVDPVDHQGDDDGDDEGDPHVQRRHGEHEPDPEGVEQAEKHDLGDGSEQSAIAAAESRGGATDAGRIGRGPAAARFRLFGGQRLLR